FAQIGTPATNSYNDLTAAQGISYSYRVRAADAASNLSGYSGVATGTIPDTQAPSAPGTLTATANGSQITLNWVASTDNVAVTGYLIERCQDASCVSFTQIAAPAGTGTSYPDPGLTSGTSYSYRVRATDAATNLGAYSNVATAVIPDTIAPSAPTDLAAT